jgi:two-component system, chemotaxis family, CheB/CheR fusion protein
VTSSEGPSSTGNFLVIGVGASAGGVEALGQLFGSMPVELDAAFVIVTHLGPHRESLLTEILSRRTSYKVVNATDGEPLRAGRVYVMPADAILSVHQERLQVRPTNAEQRERNPIDIFLASLAADLRERAVGIILSGAGSDGTLGVKAIKEDGGLTIAQGHGATGPRHEGMPHSAIASGLIDLVVPVEDIGTKLQEYARSFLVLTQIAAEGRDAAEAEALAKARKEIYATLRKRVGHDFEGYKEKTFLRRVQRRMQVLQINDVTAYAARLREDGDESSLLFRDLLIGVTGFFRDTGAFDAMAEKVMPRLFEQAGAGDIVRVWVPGCATGEEAYSIAILLREQMLKMSAPPRVQVFATDIDDTALAVARSGRYPAAMLDGVSGERLERFFRADPGSYVLTKEIRDLCIFSAHSVIRDPPLSRMDLVSCRNLLIYFSSDLQDSVLPIFHYALRPGGFLFLGPSESISRQSALFGAIDKKQRIFQRRPGVKTGVRVAHWMSRERWMARPENSSGAGGRKDQQLKEYIESQMLESFTPAHIVVEGDGNIVYYSSGTGKYMEPQVGSPSRQVLSMARKGLRLELRTALNESVERRRPVIRERVEVELEDRIQPIRLTVQPIAEGDQEPLYLLVFSDIGPPMTREEAAQYKPAGADVTSLELELRETRDRLQAMIEEYETALEELKSGNEELVSVNEELQSTNEELETSKEELQSVNEELYAVNHELAAKVDALHRSNADLRHLFESTQIATIFLDRCMLIRNFTPAVTAIFNLIPADRGRPITDIAHQLDELDLQDEIDQVLKTKKVVERPVAMRGGKTHHLMRVLPYCAADNEIDGALITFVNITALVEAEEQQHVLISELNHRVRNMLQVVIGLSNQTLHRSVDLRHYEAAFMGRMQALARAYELLSRDGWQNVAMSELLQTQLSPFASEGRRYQGQGGHVVLRANAALSLGLVLYELATNAVKYGALSVPEGRIDVAWGVEKFDGLDAMFSFEWRESGGPTVTSPVRRGLGSELLERQLRYELNADSQIDFAESGVHVSLRIPAAQALVSDEG